MTIVSVPTTSPAVGRASPAPAIERLQPGGQAEAGGEADRRGDDADDERLDADGR